MSSGTPRTHLVAAVTHLVRDIRRSALAAVLAVAPAVGCGRVQDAVRDAADFQRELAAEFRTPDTNVTLTNGTVLTVTLHNSPIANPPSAAGRETCRRVAEFVRDHYRGYENLRAVQVAFGARRGAVAVTSSEPACRFDTKELGPARQGRGGTD
jgi:hypothetical protein